jgi:hypothetical protein
MPPWRRCSWVPDVLVSLAEGAPGRADLARRKAITLQGGSHTGGPGIRSAPLLAIAAGQAARNELCRPPGDLRVLLGDPRLQQGNRPLLRGHERRQLLVGRRGHGPILHTPSRITRSRHAAQDLNSHWQRLVVWHPPPCSGSRDADGEGVSAPERGADACACSVRYSAGPHCRPGPRGPAWMQRGVRRQRDVPLVGAGCRRCSPWLSWRPRAPQPESTAALQLRRGTPRLPRRTLTLRPHSVRPAAPPPPQCRSARSATSS